MRALLIVDLQNDFLPGGSLAVPQGDLLIPVVNRLTAAGFFDLVVASKDWHPLGHISFAETHGKEVGDVIEVEGVTQSLWPIHCVQGEEGAEFADSLDTSTIEHVSYKGTDVSVDSYSAFQDNAKRRATDLEAYLRKREVDELYIVGLCTDYCVKASALDALAAGFKVRVILDACCGVDLNAGDIASALAAMQKAGAQLIQSEDIVGRRP